MKKGNRLVVADSGWAETIPEWLLDEVRAERLTLGLGGLISPDCEKVGDAEVCVYLYTASLTVGLPHEDAEIYIYLTAKLMKRRGQELPDFMAEKLERGFADESRELEHLRNEIYSKRGGDISHPLLDAMRSLKKEIMK